MGQVQRASIRTPKLPIIACLGSPCDVLQELRQIATRGRCLHAYAWVLKPVTTRHAGCLEAVAEPRALQLAFWTLHRPPNSSTLTLALRLLHALSPTPAAAWAAAAAAGALFALSVLLPTAPPDEANRVRPWWAALSFLVAI